MSKAGRLLSFESTFQGYPSTSHNEAVYLEKRDTDSSFLYSQGKKKRQHGTDAVKSHIVAAKTVAGIVKTSLV